MASQTVQPHETVRAGNGRSQWATDLKYRWPARYRSSWVALALTLAPRGACRLCRPQPRIDHPCHGLGRSPGHRGGRPDAHHHAGRDRSLHLGHHLGGCRHRGPLRDRGIEPPTRGGGCPRRICAPQLGERSSHLRPAAQCRDRDARHARHDPGRHQPPFRGIPVRHGRDAAATAGPGPGLGSENQRRVRRRNDRLRAHGRVPQQDQVRASDRGSGFESPRGTRPGDAGQASRARHLRRSPVCSTALPGCCSPATSARRTSSPGTRTRWGRSSWRESRASSSPAARPACRASSRPPSSCSGSSRRWRSSVSPPALGSPSRAWSSSWQSLRSRSVASVRLPTSASSDRAVVVQLQPPVDSRRLPKVSATVRRPGDKQKHPLKLPHGGTDANRYQRPHSGARHEDGDVRRRWHFCVPAFSLAAPVTIRPTRQVVTGALHDSGRRSRGGRRGRQ